MKKPKIEITDTEPITELQRDIIIAGAQEGDPGMIKKAIEDGFTVVIPPHVVEQLKELGMTPEQFVEKIQKGEEI